jgi:hypothetical protein
MKMSSVISRRLRGHPYVIRRADSAVEAKVCLGRQLKLDPRGPKSTFLFDLTFAERSIGRSSCNAKLLPGPVLQ